MIETTSRKQVCFTQYAEILEFSPITDPVIKSQLYYSRQDLKWMKIEAKQSARNKKRKMGESQCQQSTNNAPIKRRVNEQVCFQKYAEVLEFSPIIDPTITSQIYYSPQDLQRMELEAEKSMITYLLARNRKIIMEQLQHQQRMNKAPTKRRPNEALLLNNEKFNERIRLSNTILVS